MTTIENRALAADAAEKLLTVDDLCEYLVVSKDFIYDEVRQRPKFIVDRAEGFAGQGPAATGPVPLNEAHVSATGHVQV